MAYSYSDLLLTCLTAMADMSNEGAFILLGVCLHSTVGSTGERLLYNIYRIIYKIHLCYTFVHP